RPRMAALCPVPGRVRYREPGAAVPWSASCPVMPPISGVAPAVEMAMAMAMALAMAVPAAVMPVAAVVMARRWLCWRCCSQLRAFAGSVLQALKPQGSRARAPFRSRYTRQLPWGLRVSGTMTESGPSDDPSEITLLLSRFVDGDCSVANELARLV